MNMCLEVKAYSVNVWPPYNEVRKAKAGCRPPKEAMSSQVIKVKVSFQALLNHTTTRSHTSKYGDYKQYNDRSCVTVFLELRWMFR